jgi:hypothetical protein
VIVIVFSVVGERQRSDWPGRVRLARLDLARCALCVVRCVLCGGPVQLGLACGGPVQLGLACGGRLARTGVRRPDLASRAVERMISRSLPGLTRLQTILTESGM